MSIKMYLSFIKVIAIFFLAILLFLTPSVAFANERIDLYSRVDQDISKIDELNNYTEKTKDDFNGIITKLTNYQTYFKESSAIYDNLTKSSDSKISSVAKESKVNATTLNDSIGQMIDGLNNSDETKYNGSISQTNKAIDGYNKIIIELNEGATDYGPVYIFAVIFFSIISLILLIKAKIKPQFSSEIAKKECEMELFKSSLWPAIGSIITLVWYKLTPPGGTYYILWGPILIGLFYFIKQSWVYAKEVRPVLRVTIEAEREEFMKKEQLNEEENYCTSCGSELTISAHFCKNCGSKII